MAAVNLIGSYNYALVALSVLIAMFASYAALDLAGRVTAAGGWTRAVWLLGGAGAMGTGIWSMHYIGMLAFVLPIPVAYHWPTVLLSLLAAIFASVVAPGVVSRRQMGAFRALAGSVLMGAGIASMHYIGMAAMRLSAICQFNSFLVVVSVVFAVLISLAALWIAFHFRDQKKGIGWEKVGGAVVMGAAIPVMHYTGMAAASFTPSSMPADLSRAVSISTLGTAGITAVTFIVLGLALLTSWMDRRFAAQTLELQEEKLQRSEAYLAEAQRLSHTGSFGWRPSTGEIIWSEETFRIFEYERTTKLTVELVLQRIHPEDVKLVKHTIERASQDGKDFEYECRLVMPHGSVKNVHVMAQALSDESGGIEFVGAVLDVTVAKRAEARIRQIIDTIPAYAWSTEPDGSVDFINERFLEFTGRSIEELRGWGWASAHHPDDVLREIGVWRAALAAGEPMESEVRMQGRDGDYRWLLIRNVPLRDELGNIVKWYGTAFEIEDRKRAEEQLRKTETELRQLIAVIPQQVFVFDSNWNPLFANRREREYAGLTLQEMQSKDAVAKIFHPEDLKKLEAIRERGRSENAPFELEARIRGNNGEYRWFLIRDNPLRDEQGRVLQWYGTRTDIEDRKRGEVLLAGEKRLLEMIAGGDSLVLILKGACLLVEELASGSLCSILLLDPSANCLRHGAAPSLPVTYTEAIDGAIIGQSVGSCGTAAYRAEPVIVSDIATDPLWVDYRDVALAHGLRACWSTPILSSAGRVLGTFTTYYREPRSPTPQEENVIERITHLASIAIERKRAEETLRASEAYLAEAQRLSHTGSWAWNVATKRLFWSAETFKIFGFDPNTPTPTTETFLQRVHPDDRAAIEQVETELYKGTDAEYNYRIVLPDNSMKYIRSVAHPITNDLGQVIEFVGTVIDVTERKRAEEERERLREAQADLAYVTRVTTMGELTASLAHEVNQPIAAASMNASACLHWLIGETPNIEEARAAAARIVKDGTRAGEIIRRIRLLFKKGTPQRDLVDVNEVIGEMIVLLRGETTRYSISVRTELAADLPQVMGDRVQLQQVMMNLLMNSIDAMKDADGTRELAIKSQRAENEEVVVSVTDSGVGLPPQQADEIFSAFFTTKPHGTGMGLRISRSIIESHGGRLWAADNSPRGASFYFALPRGGRDA